MEYNESTVTERIFLFLAATQKFWREQKLMFLPKERNKITMQFTLAIAVIAFLMGGLHLFLISTLKDLLVLFPLVIWLLLGGIVGLWFILSLFNHLFKTWSTE